MTVQQVKSFLDNVEKIKNKFNTNFNIHIIVDNVRRYNTLSESQIIYWDIPNEVFYSINKNDNTDTDLDNPWEFEMIQFDTIQYMAVSGPPNVMKTLAVEFNIYSGDTKNKIDKMINNFERKIYGQGFQSNNPNILGAFAAKPNTIR